MTWKTNIKLLAIGGSIVWAAARHRGGYCSTDVLGQPCLFVGPILLGKKSVLFDSRRAQVAAYICCLLRILRAAPPALTLISRGDANAGYFAVSANRLRRHYNLYLIFELYQANANNSTVIYSPSLLRSLAGGILGRGANS